MPDPWEKDSLVTDNPWDSDVLVDEKPTKKKDAYVGVTKPDYTTEYGEPPEGFIDFDSLGTTPEERQKKAQELLQAETPQNAQVTSSQKVKLSDLTKPGRQFPGQVPFVDTPEEKKQQYDRYVQEQPLMKRWAMQFGEQYGKLQEDKITKATDELTGLKKVLDNSQKNLDTSNPQLVDAYNQKVNEYNSILEEQGINLKEMEKGYNLVTGVINANQQQRQQQQAGTTALLKGVQQKANEPGLSGLPLSVEIFSKHQTDIQQHPEKMSEEEALNYYQTATENSVGINVAGEKVTPQKLMSGAYKFIPSFIKNYIDPAIKDLFPEQYKFLKADQIRKKEGAEGYAEYGANMIGELAGLFAFAGPIHEGYNTMGAIGRLAKTNPKVAGAISSFLAGGTYSALTNAPNVAEGETSVQGAVADAIATGLVFAAFSQVGTKDWLKLYKSGAAQEVTIFSAGGNVVKQGLQAIKGKEKEYLARSLGNWLIDTGAVTGVSGVSNRVATAVEMSDKNNTSLISELQKQFTQVDLAQLGIEFAINAMFTGGIPRNYKLPPKPLGPERQIGKEAGTTQEQLRQRLQPPPEGTEGVKPTEPTGPVTPVPVVQRDPRSRLIVNQVEKTVKPLLEKEEYIDEKQITSQVENVIDTREKERLAQLYIDVLEHNKKYPKAKGEEKEDAVQEQSKLPDYKVDDIKKMEIANKDYYDYNELLKDVDNKKTEKLKENLNSIDVENYLRNLESNGKIKIICY